jgi:anti-sigma-K factor RskA
VNLSSDLDETRSALDRSNAAATVLADPDARSVALAEGSGRLVVDSDGRAVLVVDDLSPAPSGKTYEMWVASQGEDPQPAGLFPGRDGRDIVPVEGTVEDGQVVLVTIEDAGGVDAPTTEPILGSAPV